MYYKIFSTYSPRARCDLITVFMGLRDFREVTPVFGNDWALVLTVLDEAITITSEALASLFKM